MKKPEPMKSLPVGDGSGPRDGIVSKTSQRSSTEPIAPLSMEELKSQVRRGLLLAAMHLRFTDGRPPREDKS